MFYPWYIRIFYSFVYQWIDATLQSKLFTAFFRLESASRYEPKTTEISQQQPGGERGLIHLTRQFSEEAVGVFRGGGVSHSPARGGKGPRNKQAGPGEWKRRGRAAGEGCARCGQLGQRGDKHPGRRGR